MGRRKVTYIYKNCFYCPSGLVSVTGVSLGDTLVVEERVDHRSIPSTLTKTWWKKGTGRTCHSVEWNLKPIPTVESEVPESSPWREMEFSLLSPYFPWRDSRSTHDRRHLTIGWVWTSEGSTLRHRPWVSLSPTRLLLDVPNSTTPFLCTKNTWSTPPRRVLFRPQPRDNEDDLSSGVPDYNGSPESPVYLLGPSFSVTHQDFGSQIPITGGVPLNVHVQRSLPRREILSPSGETPFLSVRCECLTSVV